jgi:hypothetical protein
MSLSRRDGIAALRCTIFGGGCTVTIPESIVAEVAGDLGFPQPKSNATTKVKQPTDNR